jgi:hypothetical protein
MLQESLFFPFSDSSAYEKADYAKDRHYYRARDGTLEKFALGKSCLLEHGSNDHNCISFFGIWSFQFTPHLGQ